MRRFKNHLLIAFSGLSFICVQSQETFKTNGPKEKLHTIYAFKNATVVVSSSVRIEKATLLIQDGKIIEVGTNVKMPSGAIVTDLEGKYIYPSFIDLDANYGLPEVKKEPWNPIPQYESNKKGAYNWNQAVAPEVNASELFNTDLKKADEFRKNGFGAVLIHQRDGVIRGTSAVVSLADIRENSTLLKEKAGMHFSFNKGSSRQAFPSSQMGSIALIRQTYLDANWYANSKTKTEKNISLNAFNEHKNLPQFFEVQDKLEILRADRMGDEFGVQYIIRGNGDEYQRLDEIAATNATLIVPVNFPKPFDVEDPYTAMMVSLSDLKHWELAPHNLKLLEKRGIRFAITANGTEKNEFLNNLRIAVSKGLTEQTALKALTETPALLVGLEKQIGKLEKGMLANFFISSGNIFDSKSIIYENWNQGIQYKIHELKTIDLAGDYELNLKGEYRTIKISGNPGNQKGTIEYSEIVDSLNKEGKPLFDANGKPIKTKAQKTEDISLVAEGSRISFSFNTRSDSFYRFSGSWFENGGMWYGDGQDPTGKWFKWSAIRKSTSKKAKEDLPGVVTDTALPSAIIYPFVTYGNDTLPKQGPYLIKNATVWTLEEDGILKEASVYIRDGKIVRVGKILDITDPKAIVIDAKGKHVTPGIIDEHSHIAISKGVNEGSESVTAEVRIGDVVNSDDINIYRQLSGGVTAAQLLHGSANVIGGQSAIIKLKWGSEPEKMKIQAADGFIKCALGENVKQTNWGEYNRIRYPQTRMGVEQIFYDAFYRAKEYEQSWKNYQTLSGKKKAEAEAPRKDLELECLVEILNSKRFISCHSYVQSEINMLMKVADSMGFRLNTFTHILEGYKVADKMKAHGAGASTFSDWWAYKYEVNDAIPYNASILNRMGITTAINSDDAEMGRRLNQEAAKGIKYGGMSEEDALKMVTLNPAKLLHLDKQTGSIKAGKDADIVIWSDHPLSIQAKAEKTFVDGVLYFDRSKKDELEKEIAAERARIIAKMLEAKKNGSQTQSASFKTSHAHKCWLDGHISDEKF
ncbi:MAG: amidohydrolase family protein [Flavobacteriales bacterium]